jgi:hypothetical protein
VADDVEYGGPAGWQPDPILLNPKDTSLKADGPLEKSKSGLTPV